MGLGVLSVHFEAGRCRVRCPFCYLGQRSGADDDAQIGAGFDAAIAEEAIAALDYRELAVTLSEPIEGSLGALARLVRAANSRGRLVAVTTTLAVIRKLPAEALTGVGRLNLSVDPWKGQVHRPVGRVEAADVAVALAEVRAKWQAERVLIVTLSNQRFAEALWNGLLAELLDLEDVDRVALNALKPPPPWCDRAFWMAALARIGPLLRMHLDRRLFLDCYVAARILGLGDCPARPDLSPVAATAGSASGLSFRSCVYQPAPDFIAETSAELADRLRDFRVPASCPFPIR